MTARYEVDNAFDWHFFMADATDDETAETGIDATITVKYRKSTGTSWGTVSGTPDDLNRGWYKIEISAAIASDEGILLLEAYDSAANTYREPIYLYEPDNEPVTALTTAALNDIADRVLFRNWESAAFQEGEDTYPNQGIRQTLAGVVAFLGEGYAISGNDRQTKLADGTIIFVHTATGITSPSKATIFTGAS